MEPFRRRCQALAAASGTRIVVTSEAVWLRGPLEIPIPWNPIQGFIPLPLLAGSLVAPSPLPSFSGETDTQLERLGGHSLAVTPRFSQRRKNAEFGKPLRGFVTAESFSTSNLRTFYNLVPRCVRLLLNIS